MRTRRLFAQGIFVSVLATADQFNREVGVNAGLVKVVGLESN